MHPSELKPIAYSSTREALIERRNMYEGLINEYQGYIDAIEKILPLFQDPFVHTHGVNVQAQEFFQSDK